MNAELTRVKANAYRLRSHEEVKAKQRSHNRVKWGHITYEEHCETLRLWNETHSIEDEAEYGRAVRSLREREREQEHRLVNEGTASALILTRRKMPEEEKEATMDYLARLETEHHENLRRRTEEVVERQRRNREELKASNRTMKGTERKRNRYTEEEKREALEWFEKRGVSSGRIPKPPTELNDENVWYRIYAYRNWKAKQLADATAWLESVD